MGVGQEEKVSFDAFYEVGDAVDATADVRKGAGRPQFSPGFQMVKGDCRWPGRGFDEQGRKGVQVAEGRFGFP